MLFLAALAHSILILGVTFTSIQLSNIDTLPQSKITLIAHISRLGLEPKENEYLALGSQHNQGIRVEDDAPTTKPFHNHSGAKIIQPDEIATVTTKSNMRTKLRKLANREALVGPNIHESALSEYLNAWRRRVERIGTENFPEQAHESRAGNPTLEVALSADGALEGILILRSSGNEGLDKAALRILRLATPFEPLPKAVRAEYDVLRFAYEWEFTEGWVGKRPDP